MKQSTLASAPLYCLAALFVKITLLVLYLRIFETSLRARVMLRVGIVVVVLFYVGTAFAHVLLPRPAAQENFTVANAQKDLQRVMDLTMTQGVVGAVTDLYILFIPFHLVVRLHLPLGRKIGVCAIFLTGLM